MKDAVLTPAPTAASVNATSTAPSSVHKRRMEKLKALSSTTALSRSRTVSAATATITAKTAAPGLRMQSFAYPSPVLSIITVPSFVHGVTPDSKAERSNAWVAVGLARNQNTAMDMSFTL